MVPVVFRYKTVNQFKTLSEFTRSVLVLRLSLKWIGRGVKSLKLSNLALNRSIGLLTL